MMRKGKTIIKATAHILWQNKAIVILLVLLGGIIIITAPGPSSTTAAPAAIGIVREPNAYCTFTEINSNDSRYSVSKQTGIRN